MVLLTLVRLVKIKFHVAFFVVAVQAKNTNMTIAVLLFSSNIDSHATNEISVLTDLVSFLQRCMCFYSHKKFWHFLIESLLLVHARKVSCSFMSGLSGAFSLAQSAIDKAELLYLRCSPAGPSWRRCRRWPDAASRYGTASSRMRM